MDKKRLFPLVVNYSFDNEIPVYLFDTEEEAFAEMKKQFDEELRIQTEENEHVIGEDIEAEYVKNDHATIRIFWDTEEDVMTWRLGDIKN